MSPRDDRHAGILDQLLAGNVDPDRVDQVDDVENVDQANVETLGDDHDQGAGLADDQAGDDVDDRGDDQGDDQAQEEDRPSRQAATYRHQLRQTQAERDGLAGHLEESRRALVEHLVAGELPKPAALWAAGTTVDDLLDEDGRVDPAKVLEAATTAREELGIPRRPRARPDQHQASSANSPQPRRSATVRDVLDQAVHGEGAVRKTGSDQVDEAAGSLLEFLGHPR